MTTSATAQTAQLTTQERTNELIQAARQLIHEHDTWANDPTTPEAPSQRVELAANILIDTAAAGDIPASCRELVAAITNFGEEWRAYENGRQMPGGLPMRSLWNAYSSITHTLKAAERPQKRRIEPVAEMKRQGLNYTQIARAYGKSQEIGGEQVWTGPFYDQNGAILVELVEKEAQQPGSVIPEGWVHPLDQESSRDVIQNLNQRLERIRSEDTARPTEDPVQLLRDGAYPGQVANVCGISINEVYALAEQNGIAVESRSASEIYAEAVADPQPAPQTALNQPRPQHEPPESPVQSTDPESEPKTEPDTDTLRETVYEIADANPQYGAPDIVRTLRELHGITATGRQVSAFLRHRK